MTFIRRAQVASVFIALALILGAAGYGIVRGFTDHGSGGLCEARKRQTFNEGVRLAHEQGIYNLATVPYLLNCDAYVHD